VPDECGKTIYAFRVRLQGCPDRIWRTIEMRGSQTLRDLHDAIQRAFGWDGRHLYSFFLNNKRWDLETEYTVAEGAHGVDVMIGSLGLEPKQKFLYIFDFTDELRHAIRVVSVKRGIDTSEGTYPHIVRSHGRSPSQSD
jgi:hypothetical protein